MTYLRVRICFVARPNIPWPHTTLGAAKDIKNNDSDQIMIKFFHDYPTMKKSSAFKFHASMKCFKNSTVGNTVLHEATSSERKIESHFVLGHGIC